MTLIDLCRTKNYLTFVIFALLLLPFIFSNNVFADSNPTVTFTGGVSVSNSVAWFPNCDAACISQYSYLKITVPTPLTSFYSNVRVTMLNNDFAIDSYISLSSSDSYYKLEGNPININFSQNTTPSTTFTAELVSDLSEPCPEPEPCNCDIPPIVQFFKETFFNIVLGIIPAFGIFAVVWFMVDLLSSLWFGRGK